MRAFLLLALLILTVPAIGGDFDYRAYRDTQLSDAATGSGIDPKVNYWLDAAHSRYHTVATFTGGTRAISPSAKRLVEMWVKSMGHPPAYREMFQREIEIRQGSFIYWLPIQQQLVAPLDREVSGGTDAHLYVLLIGALDGTPVFAVSEFDAVGA